ncbi:MAG: SusC/RagA family TonB-linked outer membrane protein [Chitinophagaceae bacterium]|nr:SusC/RagA family TonB-linked outer membrane protein [Chitinophagaceae bacterium]
MGLLYSGTPLIAQQITFTGENAKLTKIFQVVKDQTGFFVFTDRALLENAKTVSVKAVNEPLETFISTVLKGQDISFSIESKTIVLTYAPSKGNRAPSPETPGIESSIKQVNGRVTTTAGTPLAGVSVRIKGAKTGVSSNDKGEFTINAEQGQVLIFSYTGMETVELKITDPSKPIHVVLKLREAALQDVVVTGVRTVRQESFTGSATTIKGDDLRRVGNQNVFQSLKNLDPTINIMENLQMGSNPNAMPVINMRGGTSFNESMGDPNLKGNYQNKPNQPLFILDGFETSIERIFDLDMNIVQSISILRDASAKALYGSRAANGVVVIETKPINATKPRLSYTGSLDITMPDLSSYNLLNALQKLDVEYAEGQYPETNPSAFTNYNKLRKQVLEGLNTDWLSKPVQMGYGNRQSLNIDLGKDELRTQINLSMFDNVGVMKGSGRKTLTGGLNMLYRVNRFKFQNRLSIVSNKSSDSPYGSFSTYTLLNPYLNPYDDYGNYVTLMGGVRNPLNDGAIPTSLTAKYSEITNNFEAEYQILNGLSVRTRASLYSKKNNADRYYPVTHTRFASYSSADAYRKGSYEANYGSEDRISGDLYLNYNAKINNKHNLFLTGGFNLDEKKYREEIHYVEGFPSVNMDDIMFAYQYSQVMKRPSGITGIKREFGMLSMLSYTFMDRFLFDGTFRLNGSSTFGNDNRMAPFWSLGLGWNLHKEKFMREYAAIKLLKIRGSIGTSGNQNFLNNKSLTVNNYYLEDRYAGLIGSYATNMENPGLKWEQKLDYNLGLDADIYKLTIKFDLYRTVTNNLVTSASTAPSTGYMTVSENLGKVENKGVEIGLSYTVFQTKAGFLRLNGSYVYNKNVILKISDAMRSFNDKQQAIINDRTNSSVIAANTTPPIMYYDGLAMNTIWAVPSYGIDPATGIELLRGKDGLPTYIWKASDMVPSGISVPKWRGTFGFNGEYKGFGISVYCTYLGGGQYYNTTLLNKVENIAITSNFDKRVLTDRWMKPGQEAQFKRLAGNTPYDMRNGIYWYSAGGWSQEATRPTQRFVQNQNELNISSIAISYEVGRKFIAFFGMERLRLDVYMNDLVKFSTIGIERGTDYPFARTISFKLSATF